MNRAERAEQEKRVTFKRVQTGKGEETTKKLCLAAKYDDKEQAEKVLKEILEDNPQFEGKAEKCKK